MSTKVDGIKPLEDGSIKWTVGGALYWLRAPTIGETREINARIRQLQEDDRGLPKITGSPDAGEDDETITAEEHDELQTDLLLNYWRWLIGYLERDGKELAVPNDDCPRWMSNSELLREFSEHWRLVPWGPGGAPSQQQAAAAARQAQQLAATLQPLLTAASAAADSQG